MSLGGFAYGLAESIESAEARYQRKKEREEDRANKLLDQANARAYQEKLFSRRRRLDAEDNLMETVQGLRSLGLDDTQIASIAPAGKYGFEIAKSMYTKAQEQGVHFPSMVKTMYPEGFTADTFGDIDLGEYTSKILDYRFDKKKPDRPFLKFEIDPLSDTSAMEMPFEDIGGTTATAEHLQLGRLIEDNEFELAQPNITSKRRKQLTELLEARKARFTDLTAEVNKQADKSAETTGGLKATDRNSIRATYKQYYQSQFADYVRQIGDELQVQFKGNLATEVLPSFQQLFSTAKGYLTEVHPDTSDIKNIAVHNEHVNQMKGQWFSPYNTLIDRKVGQAIRGGKTNVAGGVIDINFMSALSADAQKILTTKENADQVVRYKDRNGVTRYGIFGGIDNRFKNPSKNPMGYVIYGRIEDTDPLMPKVLRQQ